MSDYSVITVDASNADEYGIFCIKNKKHPGYIAKHAWLKQRFADGLRMKMIQTNEDTIAGFLEYIPGEYSWRAVNNAAGYMIIHCIWVVSDKFPYKGMASALIRDCVNDANVNGKAGVAVVTSDGPWMATPAVFLKNGFAPADEAEPHYQLLVKQLRDAPLPSFPENWDQRLAQFRDQDLHLIYTNQCPYIGKAITELPSIAQKYGIELKMTELNDPVKARVIMPSPYGVFNLVYQGRLLADHPISATRFKNILEGDLKLEKPAS